MFAVGLIKDVYNDLRIALSGVNGQGLSLMRAYDEYYIDKWKRL